MTGEEKRQMISEMMSVLTRNILPFWIDKMTDPRGGYFGRMDGNGIIHAEAPKGAIMHGRILWTMAAAYKATGNKRYLEAARRAYDCIDKWFVDREYGGVFLSVDPNGSPFDTKKQFYAIAFVIYGLAEYYAVTSDQKGLDLAISLFKTIEEHSRDYIQGGYIEAKTRDWHEVDDMRLSAKDANAIKTMNTHLHILEAYSALYRIWKDDMLRNALRGLIHLFLEKIIDNKSNHLGLFFDNDWHRQDSEISYGHDIEASWLLLEAAETLGDKELYRIVKEKTRKIADAALQGRCYDGSMIYERHGSGHYDNEKHWWVQAENVVGQLYLWKHHKMDGLDDKAIQTWEYIKNNLVDSEGGEWYWSRLPSGLINPQEDKAGYWKCPYHNGRMVLESCKLLEED